MSAREGFAQVAAPTHKHTNTHIYFYMYDDPVILYTVYTVHPDGSGLIQHDNDTSVGQEGGGTRGQPI